MAAFLLQEGFGDPLAICKAIEPHLAELQIDQLIYEYGDWVHLAIAGPGDAPRCECLTINENGTTAGIVA